MWDLGSAKKLVTLQGHIGPIWSLAYSCGSGSLLVSGARWKAAVAWAEGSAVGGNVHSGDDLSAEQQALIRGMANSCDLRDHLKAGWVWVCT